jgi:hypothetical protein
VLSRRTARRQTDSPNVEQRIQYCRLPRDPEGGEPAREPGQIVKTFRLPGQPEIVLRERGPRTLWEVPPGELIAVMPSLRVVGQDEEAWFRAVLGAYESKRLTEPIKAWLRRHAQHVSDP